LRFAKDALANSDQSIWLWATIYLSDFESHQPLSGKPLSFFGVTEADIEAMYGQMKGQ
jgi:hypothetical protein